MPDGVKLSIYIAGPMAGDPDHHTKFMAAEAALMMKGWIVINPDCLPEGLERGDYMPICLAMIQAADTVVMLKGWEDSKGACIERAFAAYNGKKIYTGIEEVPVLRGEQDA